VYPVPDPLFLRKCGSAGNQTRDLWICSQELWPLDRRDGRNSIICYVSLHIHCLRQYNWLLQFSCHCFACTGRQHVLSVFALPSAGTRLLLRVGTASWFTISVICMATSVPQMSCSARRWKWHFEQTKFWSRCKAPIQTQFGLPFGLHSWSLKGKTDVCGAAVRSIVWTVGL
jgi:hypothetical protein